jgi:hypothetical protein
VGGTYLLGLVGASNEMMQRDAGRLSTVKSAQGAAAMANVTSHAKSSNRSSPSRNGSFDMQATSRPTIVIRFGRLFSVCGG